MNKMMIVIMLCSSFALTSCGKTDESEMNARASEESSSTLMDKGSELDNSTWEETKEISSDVATKSQEAFDSAKDTTGEVIDSAKEKSSEVMDEMNK